MNDRQEAQESRSYGIVWNSRGRRALQTMAISKRARKLNLGLTLLKFRVL